MTPEIHVEENPAQAPVCPHCEKEIRKILTWRIRSLLGVRFLYACGDCRKVMGVSHRKGFWMG